MENFLNLFTPDFIIASIVIIGFASSLAYQLKLCQKYWQCLISAFFTFFLLTLWASIRVGDLEPEQAAQDVTTFTPQDSLSTTEKDCIEIINIMIADGTLQKYEKDCIHVEKIKHDEVEK